MEQKNGAEISGNTNAEIPKNKKFRSYALTIFDVKEAEKLKELNYKYLIIGKEICPKTKNIHYQTFVQFKNSISFKSLKKSLPTSHIEVTKGSDKQNIDYCSKDKDIYFEDGTKPYGKLTCKELKEMSYEDIINFDARCHQSYIKAKNILENDIDIDELKKDILVYYIQGPSGVGKTEKAKELVRNLKDKYGSKVNMIKFDNNFYIGVGSAKIAIYDDFRDSHMKASEFINLIDYNIHHMNIKGGEKQNKYNLIIITSIQKIKDIYRNMNGEPRKQWERRIQLIDLYKEEDDDNDIDII